MEKGLQGQGARRPGIKRGAWPSPNVSLFLSEHADTAEVTNPPARRDVAGGPAREREGHWAPMGLLNNEPYNERVEASRAKNLLSLQTKIQRQRNRMLDLVLGVYLLYNIKNIQMVAFYRTGQQQT